MKRNLNEEIAEQKEQLEKKSKHQEHIEEVEFSDGTIIKVDVGEFYDLADGILSNYGMGGCKNLKEFTKQLDQEDIDVVVGIVAAIERRNNAIHGEIPKGSENQPKQTISDSVEPSQMASRRSKSKKRVAGAPPPEMVEPEVNINVSAMKDPTSRCHATAMFLKSWGADPEKVNEAINKLKSGQIRIPDIDTSWITKENMSNPKFNTKLALETLKAAREGSINFDVSIDTLRARSKNG